ncbi:MAG: ABC transporter ATP-binding protein [Clostridia bacterium]|nr:ABC transporter ATP-binding protein [Clostridia bacterium]
MAESAIRIEHVGFTYEGTKREILHDVNLDIKKGEFITIVGPNGAGKSTLVRTMIGLNRPVKGAVHIEGEDTKKLTVAQLSRKVGFLFQNPDHQLFEDTVYREIAVGLENQGVPEEEIDGRVQEAMAFCGLTHLAERAPEELSIGEKKRTAVASIMVMGTNIIVLDEPTTGQTWANLRTLLPVIEKLNEQGKTIIMITHDMDLVSKYCQRIVVVMHGDITFDGHRDELFANDALLEEAHLTKPAVYELSQGLAALGVKPCFTVDELAAQMGV